MAWDVDMNAIAQTNDNVTELQDNVRMKDVNQAGRDLHVTKVYILIWHFSDCKLSTRLEGPACNQGIYINITYDRLKDVNKGARVTILMSHMADYRMSTRVPGSLN